jgi:hypothetical protein
MRKFLTYLFVAFVLFIVLGFFISKSAYSEGDRAGTISKFSHKGFVFKTYEGELNEGGFSGNTGNMVPRIWLFSVDSDKTEVLTKLKDALTNGKRVSLHYEERYVRFFWTGDTKYFLTDIQVAK